MKSVTSSPKVSIIICAYNSARYITETLESVLAQGYQDYEIIVLNDGSTDGTEEIIQPYFDKIIYLKQENRGLAGARNAAIKIARGEYLALLDSDDIWLPNYLEKMVGLLESNPEADVYYPNALMFGDHHLSGKIYQDIKPSTRPVTIEGLLTQKCCVFGAVIMKREILNRVGLFDEELRAAEDLDLWLRILQHDYHIDYTEEVLVKYRKHMASLSGGGSTMYFNHCIRVFQKLIDSAQATPAQATLAAERIKMQQADREIVALKEAIQNRDFASSLIHGVNVFAIRPNVKLKIVMMGLLISPQIIFWLLSRNDSGAGKPKIPLIQNKFS
jgi:glycosyltransferase involved in cell wall biosynthesis